MSPKAREILYTVGVVVFAALAVLSTFRVIDPDTAASVSAALTSVLGLFGVTVAGTAAYNTNKQRKEGAFDPASPVDQVVQGVNQVIAAKQTAEVELKKVQEALTGLVDDVPVLGPLAAEALDQILKK